MGGVGGYRDSVTRVSNRGYELRRLLSSRRPDDAIGDYSPKQDFQDDSLLVAG